MSRWECSKAQLVLKYQTCLTLPHWSVLVVLQSLVQWTYICSWIPHFCWCLYKQQIAGWLSLSSHLARDGDTNLVLMPVSCYCVPRAGRYCPYNTIDIPWLSSLLIFTPLPSPPLHSSVQKPLSLQQELLPLLHPVLFWLANSLEFYQFLTTSCDPLEFPTPSSRKESNAEEGKEEDPLSTLHSVLLYTFQQAFYSISKVL